MVKKLHNPIAEIVDLTAVELAIKNASNLLL